MPLDFSQLFELTKQLPDNERQQLAEMLLRENAANEIPEAQKQMVRERIKKYEQHPELLIDEDTALKMINNM